jgi:hypothetical protein
MNRYTAQTEVPTTVSRAHQRHVAAYSSFFSTPGDMLGSPLAVDMVAHSPRRVVLGVFGASAAIGALVARPIVGPVLAPVERCWQMPFAASGFDEAIVG